MYRMYLLMFICSIVLKPFSLTQPTNEHYQLVNSA